MTIPSDTTLDCGVEPVSLVARYPRLRKRRLSKYLLTHMRDTAKQPARLHVLTFDSTAPQPDPVHDCSGYTCSFPLCVAEREHRVTHLTRRSERARQPWSPRQAA